ncbi:MAG: MarR family transcriptional regulator [Nocardioides sp.]|uniref:MarR family winged helix-turn-helix transcriptional regulator n=1 Tax=Nocardioides sp. TaxID=35761 RepID=UPI0039E66E6C
MTRAIEAIEFESMLLGRHLSPMKPHADGLQRLERSARTLLARLVLEGPMSVPQLSEAFGLDASTLSRQTNAMIKAGLIERIADLGGGLARKLQVTEEGRRRLAEERQANVAGMRGVFEHWSPEELSTLARLMRKYNSDIERREGRSWPRP